MLIYDHASQPYGGHHFRDPSGLILRAKTLKALLVAIADYRRTNGMAPGSPEKEVETFYSTEFPHLVSKLDPASEVAEDPIARWLNRIWRNPPKEREFVESEVELARLRTCTTCQHYTTDHLLSVDARRRLIILGAGRVHNEGACKVQHWACGLAALVATPEAKPVEGCWAQASRVST